jgi:hypothetical protein
VGIWQGSGGEFLSSQTPGDARSRLCEQVWLEPAIFDLPDGGMLYALAEEDYPGLGSAHSEPQRPGLRGEQLLLREVNWNWISAGTMLQIADARLKVIEIGRMGGPAGDVRCLKLQIVEEGLVEPGAIVCALN